MSLLLTAANRAALPPLYSQDGKGKDAVAHVKFFGGGRFTFYATEFDGKDTFFGYTVSALGPDCDELGYASLSELESARFALTPGGRPVLPVERDRHFRPGPLREVIGQ